MVIIRGIKLHVVIGQLNAGNEQVVLLIGCVRAQNESVHRVVFISWPANTQDVTCTITVLSRPNIKIDVFGLGATAEGHVWQDR